MKHTIKTPAVTFIVEATPFYQGKVKIVINPLIFPELMLTINPDEAVLIAQALEFSAMEVNRSTLAA